MVVVGESTRRLLGDLFELKDMGKKELKGIAWPVRVFSAIRASSIASRFEALHAADLPALIGREEELELLLRRWSKAKSGEGQVVLLSGEAGIGKSRLSAALLERLATEQHRACVISAHRNTPTVRCSRLSVKWSGPPDWRMTIPRKCGSTNLISFWRKPRPQRWMGHSLLKCFHCQTMDAIPSVT